MVDSATTLARGINSLSGTYQTQRQEAQAAIPATLDAINSNLTTIGALSEQIMGLQATGGDTAELQNQRLDAMTTLSSSLGVVFTPTSTGDMLVSTTSGLALPTRPYVEIPVGAVPSSNHSAEHRDRHADDVAGLVAREFGGLGR